MATILTTITLQDRMTNALTSIDSAVNRMNTSLDTMDTKLKQVDTTSSRGPSTAGIERTSNAADGLITKLGQLAAAYLSFQTASKIIDASDNLVSMTARLDMVRQAFADADASVDTFRDKIVAAANDARGSFQTMADLVSMIGMNAQDAFGGTDELVRFANIIQKDAVISGASAQAAANAELQLSQAMASGVLRGQDYRSVLQQMPTVIGQIADYLGVTRGKLKEMADDGKISADIVKNAILSAGAEVDKQFEQMPMTFAQAMTLLANTAQQAFAPVLERINNTLNSEAGRAMIQSLQDGLYTLASVANVAFDAVFGLANLFRTVWPTIAPLVIGVAAGMTAYAVATGIAAAAQSVLNGAMLASPIFWIGLVIGSVIVLVYEMAQSFADYSGTASSALGVVVGILYVVGTAIQNVGIFFINVAYTISAMAQACGAAMQAAFISAITGIQAWFYNLLGTAMSVISQIAAGLNSLPFVNIDVKGLNTKAADWSAKASKLQKTSDSYNPSKVLTDTYDANRKSMDYKSLSDAYKNGAQWGDAAANKLKGLGGKAPQTDMSWMKNIGGQTAANTGDTAKNTKGVKDKLDDTSEQLKFLCDIAERDAINRFTTADISIDMVNNNTISSGLDIDGVIDDLVTKTRAGMAMAAEGA